MVLTHIEPPFAFRLEVAFTDTRKTLAKHIQSDIRTTVRTGSRDRAPTTHAPTKHARDTHTRELGTDIEKHSAPQCDHKSSVRIPKARAFNWDRRPDRRTDGQTPQVCTASPSHTGIISRTQLRSLSRTHATQSQPKPKSISRFGGRTNVTLITPNLRYI